MKMPKLELVNLVDFTFLNSFLLKNIISDPIVDEWFLMKSPGPILCILISYISFVLFIGPWFMKNREPFVLKNMIIGYNAFQVFASIYLVTLVSDVFENFKQYMFRTNVSSFQIFDTNYFLEYFYGFGCTSISPEEDLHFKKGVGVVIIFNFLI